MEEEVTKGGGKREEGRGRRELEKGIQNEDVNDARNALYVCLYRSKGHALR